VSARLLPCFSDGAKRHAPYQQAAHEDDPYLGYSPRPSARAALSGRADRWIRRTTIGCLAMLAAHARACRAARAAWVGCGAYAVVGGRDDRGGVDDAPGGVAVRWQGRVLSLPRFDGGWQAAACPGD
jgi:hypothetical protein